MRRFVGFALATLFVIGLPVWILLAIPRFNGFSMDSLEARLNEHGAYAAISQTLQGYFDDTANQQDQSQEQMALRLIKSEFTEPYIRQKLDTALDQTAAWVVDPNRPTPEVSFNDIQQHLVEQNPELKQQIDDALIQIQQGQEQTDGQLPQVVGDQQSQEALQNLMKSENNFLSVAQGDWTFSLAQPLKGLPTAYHYYVIGLPILGLLLLLLMGGIVAVGRTWPDRMRWAGWTLVVASIWNGIIFAVIGVTLLQEGLWRMVPLSGSYQDLLMALLRSLRDAVLANTMIIELLVTIGMLVVGIGLLVTARRLSKQSTPSIPTAAPLPPTQQVAESQKSGGTSA